MRRWVVGSLVGAVALFVLSAPAVAQTVELVATLVSNEENPPALSGAFGSAEVTLNLATRTITYRVDVFNLPSGVTISHIHVGAKGVNGPTIFNFTPPVNASNDFGYSGTLSESNLTLRRDQGIGSMDDAIQAMTGGQTYVNVHSAVFPGGEIRGQLVPRTAAFVPAYAVSGLTSFTASIDGGQENPGVVTGAVGTATFTLNAAAQTIAYTVRIFNVPSGTTAAHIHVGPGGVNGPIFLTDYRDPEHLQRLRSLGHADVGHLHAAAGAGCAFHRRRLPVDRGRRDVLQPAHGRESRRRAARPDHETIGALRCRGPLRAGGPRLLPHRSYPVILESPKAASAMTMPRIASAA